MNFFDIITLVCMLLGLAAASFYRGKAKRGKEERLEAEKHLNEKLEETRRMLDEHEINVKMIHQLLNAASRALYFNEAEEISGGYWSPEFREMLGYSRNDEVNEYNLWVDSLHPEDKYGAVLAFEQEMKGESSQFDKEYRLKHRNGEYFWYHEIGELRRDARGRRIAYQGVILNIQERKNNEILTREKLEAYDRAEKYQADLEDALNMAREASMAKSIFLSNMSHDIRTPMNAIIGFADIAKRHPEDTNLVGGCLDKINIAGKHLLALINDILDLSRIESGKMQLDEETVNLVQFVDELEEMVQLNLKEKDQHFYKHVGEISEPWVRADRLKLNRVILNLVGNAIKYTPNGGDIHVSLREIYAVKGSRAAYEFEIRDNGVGMTPEFMEHMFDSFERERNSATSGIQGTGLGLSITKKIVEMMDGQITSESKRNEGSVFRINFSFAVAQEQQIQAVKRDQSENEEMDSLQKCQDFLRGRQVILVDDNRMNRILAHSIMNDYGIGVDEAENGEAAIELIRRAYPGQYDLILMDVQMPIMDGLTATRKIRALSNKAASEIPIIAMSANAFSEDKEKAFASGMNDYVTKPFKTPELFGCMTRVLKAREK